MSESKGALTPVDAVNSSSLPSSELPPDGVWLSFDAARVDVPVVVWADTAVVLRGPALGSLASPPTIKFGDGFLLNTTSAPFATIDCSNSNPPPSGNVNCWYFRTPPGEGNGRSYPQQFPAGFILSVNGSTQVLSMRYATPVVDLVTGWQVANASIAPVNSTSTLALFGSGFGPSSPLPNNHKSMFNVSLAWWVMNGDGSWGTGTFTNCVKSNRTSDVFALCTMGSRPAVGAGLPVQVIVGSNITTSRFGGTPTMNTVGASVGVSYVLNYPPAVLASVSLSGGVGEVPPPLPAGDMDGVLSSLLGMPAHNPFSVQVMSPYTSAVTSLIVNNKLAVVNGNLLTLRGSGFGSKPTTGGGGGGSSTAVSYTPAGQAGMSQLGGGSTYVTGSCVLLGAANRALATPSVGCRCDGLSTWFGEGEVPYLAIQSWNSTQISVIVPPSVGLFTVDVCIGGGLASWGPPPLGALNSTQDPAGLTRRPLFAWPPPVVTATTPQYISLDGPTSLTLSTANAGPLQLDAITLNKLNLEVLSPEAAAAAGGRNVTGGWVSPLHPNQAYRLPPAYISVYMSSTGNVSVATPCSIVGNAVLQLDWLGVSPLPPSLANCTGSIVQSDTGALTLTVPAGASVGVSLVVGGGVGVAAPPFTVPSAPVILTEVKPHPVLSNSPFFSLEGSGFGSDAIQPEQMRLYSAVVGGVLATNEKFGRGPTSVRFSLPAGVVVGPHPVELFIVGQRVVLDSNSTSDAGFLFACSPGFYGHVGEMCAPCPTCGTGIVCAECQGYINSLPAVHSYPKPLPGFYDLNETSSVSGGSVSLLFCPSFSLNQHLGRRVCIVPCSPPEACLGDNFCSTGYESGPSTPRCSGCSSGYYRRTPGICVACPAAPAAQFVFLILLALVCVAGAYLAGRAATLSGKSLIVVGCLVDYLQVVGIFGVTTVTTFPPALRDLFYAASVSNVNLDLLAADCLVPGVAWASKFGVYLALPAVVVCMSVIAYLAKLCHKRCRGVTGRDKLSRHLPALVSTTIQLMSFLYVFAALAVAAPWNCAPLDGEAGGIRYLVGTLQQCSTAVTPAVSAVSIVGLILYVIAFPLGSVWVLAARRRRVMEDQLLRAYGSGHSRLTNPNAYVVLVRRRVCQKSAPRVCRGRHQPQRDGAILLPPAHPHHPLFPARQVRPPDERGQPAGGGALPPAVRQL